MNLDLTRLRAQRNPDRLARVTGVVFAPPQPAGPSPEVVAFLEAGVPIHEIKELLGHSSVATTERYAHGRVTDETRARIGAAL